MRCVWIGDPCEKLWPFEFLQSFCCSISSVSIYYVLESDLRLKFYDRSNFSRASVVEFRGSRWVMSSNQTSEWNVMSIRMLWPFEFVESFRCSISSVSLYYVLESVFCVKSYDYSNFWTYSVVQFPASRYIRSPNRISVWNVMTIQISRELLLFNS